MSTNARITSARHLTDASRIVFLSIRADEEEYSYWSATAREARKESPSDCEMLLADMLESEFENAYPRLLSPVFQGLLGLAFCKVSWVAVANRLLLEHSVACAEQTVA